MSIEIQCSSQQGFYGVLGLGGCLLWLLWLFVLGLSYSQYLSQHRWPHRAPMPPCVPALQFQEQVAQRDMAARASEQRAAEVGAAPAHFAPRVSSSPCRRCGNMPLKQLPAAPASGFPAPACCSASLLLPTVGL
jgi:hypothetical protein